MNNRIYQLTNLKIRIDTGKDNASESDHSSINYIISE